jgi:hemoglobin
MDDTSERALSRRTQPLFLTQSTALDADQAPAQITRSRRGARLRAPNGLRFTIHVPTPRETVLAGHAAAPDHPGGYDRQVTESDVYGVIGEGGFTRLVGAFYAQVPVDDILGPMYSHGDLAAAEERLRDFLVFRFGGPARYAERRGHPRLRARHAPFRIDAAARERWVSLMERALDQAALAPEADALLRAFFRDTATFLTNRPE